MEAPVEEDYGPWNPGIKSTIPNHLLAQVTLFDPRYSYVSWEDARDLSDAIGLKPQELAVTRPERLALHSVLIRVTSQLYVPDGPNYADLGISLRKMADKIFYDFVTPRMGEVHAAYNAVQAEAEQTVGELLDTNVFISTSTTAVKRGFLSRLFGKTPEPLPAPKTTTERAMALATAWKDARNEDMASASRRAIARCLGAILNTRGALLLDRDTIAKVVVGLVMNRLGSAAVGKVVQSLFADGVRALGYRWLPPQEHPVVLNAKGASASGKSTIRSAQRAIAERAGYDWRDFAIISPDYWRKALIDYESLGPDHKYAAMLCGQELEVIDRKLDILMAVKGAEGTVPHMLIDRFRFDSFQRDGARAEDSTLLTRFGAKVYLFFLVTPPTATVERAWLRGLDTGRFKAVDDLLYHNIEAYSGMPDLFFNWANGRGKWVQYEFLDNSVPLGERPRTIAYGQNGNLVIVDLDGLCKIDRYKNVNVDAQSPGEVERLPASELEASTFLRRAISELEHVDVLLPSGNDVFARATHGRLCINMGLVPADLDLGIFGDFDTTDAPFERLQDDEGLEVIGH